MTSKRGRPPIIRSPHAPDPSVIKRTRVQLDLSQAEAADLGGVSLRTWSRYEAGQSTLAPDAWDRWLQLARDPMSAVEHRSPTHQEIQILRNSARLKQTAAARLARVPLSTWQAWEAGKSPMPPHAWLDWSETMRLVFDVKPPKTAL